MVEPHYGRDRWTVTFWGLRPSDFDEIDKWCLNAWGEARVPARGDGASGDHLFWYGTGEGWVVGTLEQAVLLELTWSSVYGS